MSALSIKCRVYAYVHEIEQQINPQHIIFPRGIRDIIVQYFVIHSFDINPFNALNFRLNKGNCNILQILKTPATLKYGDYISCPDFSHSHLSENMEILRKEYLYSSFIDQNEKNDHFDLYDLRFTNVSQCSSLSTLPIFRAAFMVDMNPHWCAFGFATRKFNTWINMNNSGNSCCITFGDGFLRTSPIFDGLKQADYNESGAIINGFFIKGDIVICEIDMNARIGRIFNNKGGKSFVIGLPEDEDICIILYFAGFGETVVAVDSGFV